MRIRAEFENPGDLRPGLMVQMTIFLTPDVAAAGAETGPRRPGRHAPSNNHGKTGASERPSGLSRARDHSIPNRIRAVDP